LRSFLCIISFFLLDLDPWIAHQYWPDKTPNSMIDCPIGLSLSLYLVQAGK
jgi:hypothetical protein